MENKYQKALDNIKTIIDITNADNITRFNKLNVDILQELIDNYEANSKLCDETIAENIKLEKELAIKDKALNKACEFIKSGNELIETNIPIKELFLKESEKNNAKDI